MTPSPIIEASPGWTVRLKDRFARGPLAVPVAGILGWDAEGVVRVLQESRPGVVRTCDLATGEWRGQMLLTGGTAVLGVGVGASRALVATESPIAVTLWDLDAGEAVAALNVDPDRGYVGGLAASPDGKLVVVEAGRRVFVYELPATNPRAVLEAVAPLAVSADAAMFVAYFERARQLRVARADGSPVVSLDCPGITPPGAVDFGADGASVVAGLEDGTLLCWDLPSGALRWSRECGAGGAGIAAFARSLDGRSTYLFAPDDGLVALSSEGRPRWHRALSPPTNDPVRGRWGGRRVVVSGPAGDLIAAASPEHSLRVFDASDGQALDVFDRDARGVALAVSPDGRLVASGGADGVVRVDDVTSRATLWTLEVDEREVTGVEFLPDRPALRTCGGDGFVRVWNLTTGMEESRWPTYDRRVWTVGALDGSRVLVVTTTALELWSDVAPGRVALRTPLDDFWATRWCFSERDDRLLFVEAWNNERGVLQDALCVLDARDGQLTARKRASSKGAS